MHRLKFHSLNEHCASQLSITTILACPWNAVKAPVILVWFQMTPQIHTTNSTMRVEEDKQPNALEHQIQNLPNSNDHVNVTKIPWTCAADWTASSNSGIPASSNSGIQKSIYLQRKTWTWLQFSPPHKEPQTSCPETVNLAEQHKGQHLIQHQELTNNTVHNKKHQGKG